MTTQRAHGRCGPRFGATPGRRRARRLGPFVLMAAVAALGACTPYRVAVQQGNVITQEMVDRLRPGMTREQVAYIMGEPVIRNPFDQNQWDYVYTLRVRGRVDQRRKLSLIFAGDALAELKGDFKPGGGQAPADGADEGPDGEGAAGRRGSE